MHQTGQALKSQKARSWAGDGGGGGVGHLVQGSSGKSHGENPETFLGKIKALWVDIALILSGNGVHNICGLRHAISQYKPVPEKHKKGLTTN